MARRKQVLDVQLTVVRAEISDPEEAALALRCWQASMRVLLMLQERLEGPQPAPALPAPAPALSRSEMLAEMGLNLTDADLLFTEG